MKRSTIQLILSLLAIGLVYSADVACPTDNKFLNMLKAKNSAIVLTNVLTGTSFPICNEIWSTTGTCCDATALKSNFNESMVKDVQGGFNKFMMGLKNVGDGLQKISQVITNKDDAKTKLTTAFNANNTQFNGMTVDQAVDILGAGKTFKEDVETFKTASKDCFTKTLENAGKMFCYGCAGTTQTGVNNDDGSTTITQASCNAQVDKCLYTWRFMMKIGGLMQVISILNKASKSDAPPPKVQDKPNFGGVSMNDIMDAYKNCNNSASDATCTDANKATLCKANFNAAKPPKRASDDNMSPDNMAGLPAPSQRLLQAVTTSSGEVGVSASTGLDLTKTITPPGSDAAVDTSLTSSSSSSARMLMGTIVAFLSAIAILN